MSVVDNAASYRYTIAMNRIEHPKQHEYEEVIAFLGESYNHSHHFFALRYPATIAPDVFDYGNTFIIREQGRIASLVRIFPQTAVFRGRRAEIGGIGSVATHPDFRGRGYMQALMHCCIEEMERRGYPFSILGGDRQRYNFWDYEICGHDVYLQFSPRSLTKTGHLAPVALKRFYGDKETLARIRQCHAAQPVYIERSERSFRALFEQTIHTHLWYAEEQDGFAYMAGTGETNTISIVELGGAQALFPRMIATLVARYAMSSLDAILPDIPSVIAPIVPWACSYRIIPTCMVRILSFGATLRFLLGDERPAGWTLEIADAGNARENRAGKQFVCTRREWVQALFGPLSPVDIPMELRGFLPVPFSWPMIDHI